MSPSEDVLKVALQWIIPFVPSSFATACQALSLTVLFLNSFKVMSYGTKLYFLIVLIW